MWLSLLHHICGTHEWSSGTKFHRCTHDIRPQQEENVAYLDRDSDTFAVLKSIVMNKTLIKALHNLTQFCHTGELEVYHSMYLKYCPKRQHFAYAAMKARTMLAVMDWNNQNRQTVENRGSQSFDQVYSKRRKSWVLRKRYRRNNADVLRQDILEMVLFAHENQVNLPCILPPGNSSNNIAPCHKPDKSLMLADHTTRFSTS